MMPTRKALWSCWAILMTMTAFSLWAGDPIGTGRLPLMTVGLLLAVAAVKAVQILWIFLNLRASTPTWKASFGAFLGAIIGVVLGCAALAQYTGR